MYHPTRVLILERLGTVPEEVTYYIKLLLVSKEGHFSTEQFKNRIYNVSVELLNQIAKADIILHTFSYENDYSKQLFAGGKHWVFKPTRLFESKTAEHNCTEISQVFQISMNKMKTEVMVLKDYLDANWNNITSETVVYNASSQSYTHGSVNVLDLMLDLHIQSLPLTGKIKDYQSCLSSYYNFINSVKIFRNANTYTKGQEYLSGIQFDAEVKQSELISTKGVLNHLEMEIAQNTKKKRKIGEQINATFVTAMEKKLESVISLVTTEVFDKITDKISDTKTTMSKNYIEALKKINTLQQYFTKTGYEDGRLDISEKANDIYILRQVHKLSVNPKCKRENLAITVNRFFFC